MEKCHEYFSCEKMDCVRRKNEDLECWEIEETLCDTHSDYVTKIRNYIGGKSEACKYCIYYQQKHLKQ